MHFAYILLAKLQIVGQRLFWLTERSFLNNVDSSGRQGPLQPKTNKPIESTGTKTLCELGCLNLRKNVSPICLKKRETAHPAICYPLWLCVVSVVGSIHGPSFRP